MPSVHACAQIMLHNHAGMPRELCDAVCTLHACHMPAGTPIFPHTSRLHGTKIQAQRVSLGKEGAPQGQDLARRKGCEVEVLHEIIGQCEHDEVCTVDSILLQDARKSTCVPGFEE